jgi:hypothetical protein
MDPKPANLLQQSVAAIVLIEWQIRVTKSTSRQQRYAALMRFSSHLCLKSRTKPADSRFKHHAKTLPHCEK